MVRTIKRIMAVMGFGVLLSVTLTTPALANETPAPTARAKALLKKMIAYSGMELGNADGDYEQITGAVIRDFLRKNTQAFAIDDDTQGYLTKLFSYFEDVIYEKNAKIQFKVQAFDQGKFSQFKADRLKDKWSETSLGKFPALSWGQDQQKVAERKWEILKRSDLIGVNVSATPKVLKNDDTNNLFLEVLAEAIAQ